jgi:acyl-CoA carboxylase epsilon subunit-like protein
MMSTETIRVIKGAPEETELAALVVVLRVLSHTGPAASAQLTSRRAPWTRPRRSSGPAWVAAAYGWSQAGCVPGR